MKGFIYLLEIAVSSILIIVVLSTFFVIRVKQEWDTPDLVGVGNNIANYVSNDDQVFLRVLDQDFSDFDMIKPVNVGFGLSVKGSPKTNIEVGCVQPPLCNQIDNLLGRAYLNGRYIDFNINEFDIVGGIPDYYDALVLMDYTNYSMNKDEIIRYIKQGGIVVAINASNNNNDADYHDIFGLTTASGGGNNRFESYDPSVDDIQKYFMGIGFSIGSQWYIWEDLWTVSYGVDRIDITNGTLDIDNLMVGSTFDLEGPDNNLYSFRVKKIGPGSTAEIQPLDTEFVFKDFSEASDFAALNMKIVGPLGNAASMTANGTAIWISDFPRSDEYNSLVKAAIISRKDEWTIKGSFTEREKVTVSSFVSLCCDMPEISELEVTTWYVI